MGPDGRLWIATWDGLYTFDGERFDRRPSGPGGVPNPRVADVAAIGDDVWFTDEAGGLHRRGQSGDRSWQIEPLGPVGLVVDETGGLWRWRPGWCARVVTPAVPNAGPATATSPGELCPPGVPIWD